MITNKAWLSGDFFAAFIEKDNIGNIFNLVKKPETNLHVVNNVYVINVQNLSLNNLIIRAYSKTTNADI